MEDAQVGTVLPFVRAEPVTERTPAAVLVGEQLQHVRLRGGLAVLETKAGTVVLMDRRAVQLACLALGVVLQR